MSSTGDKKNFPQFVATAIPGDFGTVAEGVVAGPPIMSLQRVLYTQLVVQSGGGSPVIVGSLGNDPTQPAIASGLIGSASFNYSYNFDQDSWNADENFSTSTDGLDIADLGSGRLPAKIHFQYGFNGATYDRLRSFAANADALAVPTLGLLGVRNFLALFNGATFDRARSFGADADALAAPTLGLLGSRGFPALFNGATYDRLRSASAANISATTQIAALVSAPGNWTLTNAPAANTQATATRSAGAAGVRHVLTSIQASINAVAAITAPLTVVVRDGASGAGAILWTERLTAPAGQDSRVSISGLNIVGTAATAMTIEFTAAPGATNFETVSATGYSVI